MKSTPVFLLVTSMIGDNDINLPDLLARPADSHKGTFGTAMLIGGSRGMTGAIALAGMSALRSGAGRVRLLTADVCLETVAQFEPSYMTSPLAADDEGRIAATAEESILETTKAATAVGLGPGLGRSDQLSHLVTTVLYESIEHPMVIDADGLFALGQITNEHLPIPAAARILTPHPGEFARLIGENLSFEERQQRAIQLAADLGIIIVLKSHHTLITDGEASFLNKTTGNPGMATGGTGDVLTGLITGLLAQDMTPIDAARLGVYLHGLAGDLAAADTGQVALLASDLIDFLPYAVRHAEQS